MLQEKTVINECYILQSEIGEDSNTEHWVATAIFSAKRFLLRFLREGRDSDDRISRLRAESVRSYRVRGPAIADFVELESYQGRFFISSEYNAESSLLRMMESGRQWSLSQIVNAVISLADGLSSFHALDIAYGNLNAENVIIIDRGEQTPIVKIRKPSLIALLPLEGDNAHDVIETYAYLAPELKQGAESRPEGDIFSLGVHLFRFFTDSLPYPDDAATIRVSGPSLRYATVALLRCGVPEGLVRIVVGALMRNPSARYRSCVELIGALRGFLSSLKGEAVMEEGKAPITPVPSFESVDYFTEMASQSASLVDAYARKESAPARRYPERQESRARQKDDDYAIRDEELAWTVDDYLAYGMKAVFGAEYPRASPVKGEFGAIDIPDREETPAVSTGSQGLHVSAAGGAVTPTSDNPSKVISAPDATAPSVNPSVGEPSGETVLETVTTTADRQESTIQEGAPSGSGNDGAVNQVFVERKARDNRSSSDRASPASPTDQTWTRHRIRIFDIKEIIARVAKRAEAGLGSFRFIEEPQEFFAPNGLFDLLESFSGKYLYVNAGDFSRYGTADLQHCAEMLRKGFARALARESVGSRRYLARRLVAADPEHVLLDRRIALALRMPVAPPPTRVDWRSREAHLALIAAIRALARKSRPLILIVRGGENVSRNLHEFLSALAGSVEDAPIAVVVFFGRSFVEPWHALSRLERQTGGDRDSPA
jgi:serine/threonine-protein kinase